VFSYSALNISYRYFAPISHTPIHLYSLYLNSQIFLTLISEKSDTNYYKKPIIYFYSLWIGRITMPTARKNQVSLTETPFRAVSDGLFYAGRINYPKKFWSLKTMDCRYINSVSRNFCYWCLRFRHHIKQKIVIRAQHLSAAI